MWVQTLHFSIYGKKVASKGDFHSSASLGYTYGTDRQTTAIWWKWKIRPCFLEYRLKLRPEIKHKRKRAPLYKMQTKASKTYHMSRVWPGHKVCGQRIGAAHATHVHITGHKYHSSLWEGDSTLTHRPWQQRERKMEDIWKRKTRVEVCFLNQTQRPPESCSGEYCSMSYMNYWEETNIMIKYVWNFIAMTAPR